MNANRPPQLSFDLRTEPWIPCLDQSGRPVELGLRDTLARAHELREIFDGSPLTSVAITRLLLALIHRVVDGPRDEDAWQAIWERKVFDMDAFDAYFDKWADRFDLFDPTRPFYQVAGGGEGLERKPISKITYELPSEGNSALLFDHTLNATMSPADAARRLLVTQATTAGGTISYRELRHKYAQRAPLAGVAVFLVRGKSLFETLLLNLVRYDPSDQEPVRFTGDDRPAWEREEATQPAARLPNGYLDVLTWQSRVIELFPILRDDGSIVVVECVVLMGDQRAAEDHLHLHEPSMLAFQKKMKPREGRDGAYAVIRFSADRALWRDSTALLVTTAGGRRPGVIDWIQRLTRAGYGDLSPTRLLPLMAAGLTLDQARPILWRSENLTLSPRLVSSRGAQEAVARSLALAEEVSRALHDSSKQLRDVTASVELDRPYWSSLEPMFHKFLEAVATDEDFSAAETVWQSSVRRVARSVFAAAAARLTHSRHTTTDKSGTVTSVPLLVASCELAFARRLADIFRLTASKEPIA